jgi:hypothetical protein
LTAIINYKEVKMIQTKIIAMVLLLVIATVGAIGIAMGTGM